MNVGEHSLYNVHVPPNESTEATQPKLFVHAAQHASAGSAAGCGVAWYTLLTTVGCNALPSNTDTMSSVVPEQPVQKFWFKLHVAGGVGGVSHTSALPVWCACVWCTGCVVVVLVLSSVLPSATSVRQLSKMSHVPRLASCTAAAHCGMASHRLQQSSGPVQQWRDITSS